MKYIFLDRDETLNFDPGYINDPKLIQLKPHVAAGLKLLARFHYKFIILTNQSGINRGIISKQQLKAVHKRLLKLLKNKGIEIQNIYYCPHTDEDNCQCRKPKDELLKQALKFEKENGNSINYKQSYLIGDRTRDIVFGKKYNIKGILLNDQNIKQEYQVENCIYTSTNMLDAASFILENNYNQKLYKNINNFKIIRQWKSRHKKIVFTNGCFDILHPGHIQYLKQASQLGDKLVIGLNSDKSVSKLKGPNRPINNFEHRAMMLIALSFVDNVVEFKQNTPKQLLQKIKPDIHIKGGDYVAKQLPEYKIIKQYGGEVVILPFRKGFSTTKIIHKVNS